MRKREVFRNKAFAGEIVETEEGDFLQKDSCDSLATRNTAAIKYFKVSTQKPNPDRLVVALEFEWM